MNVTPDVLRYLTSAIERRVKDHLINETISRSLSDYEAEIRPLIVKAVEEITLKQFRQVMNDYGNMVAIGVDVKIIGEKE